MIAQGWAQGWVQGWAQGMGQGMGQAPPYPYFQPDPEDLSIFLQSTKVMTSQNIFKIVFEFKLYELNEHYRISLFVKL